MAIEEPFRPTSQEVVYVVRNPKAAFARCLGEVETHELDEPSIEPLEWLCRERADAEEAEERAAEMEAQRDEARRAAATAAEEIDRLRAEVRQLRGGILSIPEAGRLPSHPTGKSPSMAIEELFRPMRKERKEVVHVVRHPDDKAAVIRLKRRPELGDLFCEFEAHELDEPFTELLERLCREGNDRARADAEEAEERAAEMEAQRDEARRAAATAAEEADRLRAEVRQLRGGG